MQERLFVKIGSLDELIASKEQYGAKAKLIAGGSDVMVRVNTGVTPPEVFLSVLGAQLDYIRETDDAVVIGAAATLDKIDHSALVAEKLPVLHEAVSLMASQAVRNVATLGGNVCNASPAADSAVPLLALGAKAVVASKAGRREISMDEFFVGPGKTALKDNEVLVEIVVPKCCKRTARYYKLGRRKAETLSVVSACVAAENDNGTLRNVRVSLGSVGPRPLFAVKTAAALEGKQVDEAAMEAALRQLDMEVSPIDDVRGKASYRRRVSGALVKRLVWQILDKEEA